MGAAMFLWTCADTTPHPPVINFKWWQDRKIFGRDLKGQILTLAWGLSETGIRIFFDREIKILFSSFDSRQLLLLFRPNVWEHYQNTWEQVGRWDQCFSSYFTVWCSAPPTAFVNYTVLSVYRPVVLLAKYFLPIGFALVCWYITACFHGT